MFSHIGKIQQISIEGTDIPNYDIDGINNQLSEGWELLQVNYASNNTSQSQWTSVNTIVLLGYPREPKPTNPEEGIK